MQFLNLRIRLINLSLKVFSWFAYLMIFFEIIYMATPFALFFYSVYRFPLNFFNSHESTSWLVQSVLPHFCAVKSPVINAVLLIGWPLVITGFIIFAVGFIQIYTARFRNRGAVTVGIYRFIRHPQYAGWIILGLGMAILWSRMIVWVFYITMIFVYYYLARSEERECLVRYPDTYKNYFERTGMFFLRISNSSVSVSHEIRFTGIAAAFLLYCMIIGATVFSGQILRSFVISQLYSVSGENYMLVSVAEMDPAEMKSLFTLVSGDKHIKTFLKKSIPESDRMLIYVIPGNWKVSEIGIDSGESDDHSEPVFNPLSHGNRLKNDQSFRKIIVSKAVLPYENISGKDILAKALRQIPKLIISVNSANGKILETVSQAGNGMYGDIPVVLF